MQTFNFQLKHYDLITFQKLKMSTMEITHHIHVYVYWTQHDIQNK